MSHYPSTLGVVMRGTQSLKNSFIQCLYYVILVLILVLYYVILVLYYVILVLINLQF